MKRKLEQWLFPNRRRRRRISHQTSSGKKYPRNLLFPNIPKAPPSKQQERRPYPFYAIQSNPIETNPAPEQC
jgi:hypothetical protein